jgi:hypothetical protein
MGWVVFNQEVIMKNSASDIIIEDISLTRAIETLNKSIARRRPR